MGMKPLQGKQGEGMVFHMKGMQKGSDFDCEAKMAVQYYLCKLSDCDCSDGLLKSNEITYLTKGSRKDCGLWYSSAVSTMVQMTNGFSGALLPEQENLKKCLSLEDESNYSATDNV